MKKALRVEFEQFFAAPDRRGLRELLVQNLGEADHLDFKKGWLESSKLAKHILAMANSGGGCIVVGVEERKDKTLVSTGLDVLDDKTTVLARVRKYLPAALELEVANFSYDESDALGVAGKKFQVVFIAHTPESLPFVC